MNEPIKEVMSIDEYLAYGETCPKKDGWLEEEKSCAENCKQAEENEGNCVGWGVNDKVSEVKL